MQPTLQMLFAAVLEELAPWLETVGIQPLLCGGAAKAEEGSYAHAVKERVRKVAPGVVLKDGFLPPEGLAEVSPSVRSPVSNF